MEENIKQSRNEQIEKHLKDKYRFRFNILKSRTEWMQEIGQPYRPITKFHINSIRRELDNSKGIVTSADNLRMILESDFAERVNPVQEYFNTLDWKSVDVSTMPCAISRLAATVKVRNPEYWADCLMKWLVGVVANALNDIGCQNHVCLVLTGEQGKFKTTWLDNLCPCELRGYLFTGKIDPQNKDVQTLIAECLFINIDDQLRALNKRDENELKNLITTPAVKYRRPYDAFIEDYPHMASFMASVNGNDFLTDPTGSRRFLPFEVLEIDIEATKAIDMREVYREVMYLYKSGYRYWFNDSEIEELHRQSAEFHVQSIEYEMLIKAFEHPPQGMEESYFMTTMEIINYLSIHTYVKFSEKRMGEALHKSGFERKSKRINGTPVYGWVVCKVEPNPFHTL